MMIKGVAALLTGIIIIFVVLLISKSANRWNESYNCDLDSNKSSLLVEVPEDTTVLLKSKVDEHVYKLSQ